MRGSRARTSVVERRAERAAIEDPDIVLAAAARLLEARARSIAEVRRRLTAAGYRPELVQGAIDRLVDFAILDDEAFARAWVASRDRAHPRGERALRGELRQKGIAPEIIAAALDARAGRADGVEGGSVGIRSHGGRAGPGGNTDAAGQGDQTATGQGDEAAADRLLARNERSLLRVEDPRRRRQRAWALLARNGFDSETASEATARAERRWTHGRAASEAPE